MNDTNNYMRGATTGANQQINDASAEYSAKQKDLQDSAEDASNEIAAANQNISAGASILSETVSTINSIVSKVEDAFNSFINSNPIRKI